MCALPYDLCICQSVKQQKAVISVVRRRYGKMVTMVEGIEDTAIDIGQLAKILKGACASGGTVKGGQSNCRATTRRRLQRYSSRTATRWRCAR